MTLQERVNELQAATAEGSPLEGLLTNEQILATSPNETANPGASKTYLVVFQSRRQAIFKPFAGQHPSVCANFQQDRFEAITHEVAAWRLAHALGGHWEQLIPTAVLRDLGEIGAGVLINWREGSPDAAVFEEAHAQVHAAAFWDALVGQQDRHARNFRYDRDVRRLALIDNAFTFARPNDLNNAAIFLARRRAENAAKLSSGEKDALEAVLGSTDLLGIRRFIATDRVEAFETRANKMLERGMLPLPGAF
jgi:hypothetical protein